MTHVLVAILGDAHIPNRAQQIPEQFLRVLRDSSPELTLCTGDFTYEPTLKLIESLAPRLLKVQGNCDFVHSPEQEVVEVEGKKFGLIHGDQVHPRGDVAQLAEIAEKMNVDILIYGHTHIFALNKVGKKTLLNPGSITGAWSGGGATPLPSFCLLEGNKLTHYSLNPTPETEEYQL